MRRFDPGRDVPGVVELLESAFGSELTPGDRQWLAELARVAQLSGPWLGVLARVVPQLLTNLGGYVVERDGRLAANASLMRAPRDVWVVANVVTRPEYRRQGLALALMRQVIEEVRLEGGQEVQLQVRDDNEPARRLYLRLGFRATTSTTWLTAAAARPVEASAEAGESRVVAWGRRERDEVGRLLERLELLGTAVSGLARDGLELGLRAALGDWLSEGRRYRLAVEREGALRAVGVARVGLAPGVHRLALVVDRPWRGSVEGPLVAALLGAVAGHGALAVQAELDAGEAAGIGALEAAGFRRQRTLDRLVLRLG